jgi:benzoate-CoA ligase family protein
MTTTFDWHEVLHRPDINLADLLLFRHARQGNGTRPLLKYGDFSYTYGEMADRVARVASVLREQGVSTGSHVLLAIPDNPMFVASFFAVIACGGIATLANPLLSKEDLAYMAKHAGARTAILHGGIAEKAALLQEAGVAVVFCGDGCADIGALETLAAAAPAEPCPAVTRADDLAYVLFSSGTTGNPKAIPRRHRDILHCAHAYAEQILAMNADDVVLAVPKLTFGYALGSALLFPMVYGASFILFPQRTTAPLLLEHSERFHPSLFVGTPRMIAELLKSGRTAALSSIRIASSAGETLPPSILEQWRAALNAPLLDGFGSTEAGHIFLSNKVSEVTPGACGRPLSAFEVRLIDDAGRPLGDGGIGRLCIAGPSVAAGYLNDAARSAAAFDGNWHVSQDLFACRDGIYTYIGRADDMVKKGCGEWVSPYEVEDELLRRPEVLECAVVGTQSPNGVIALKAYVVCAPDHAVSESLANLLIEATRKRWPDFPHKHIDEIEFLDALPRNNSGKIQRQLLRQKTLTEFSYDC